MTAAPIAGLLADLPGWRDERLERDVLAFVASRGRSTDPEVMKDRILDEIERAVPAVRAELAERNTEWCGANRGRLFRAGLAELKAEKSAVAEYEALLRRGLTVANRCITEARAAEYQRRRAGDLASRLLTFAAVNLAMADESEWHPDSDAGRALVHAARAYQLQTEGVGG